MGLNHSNPKNLSFSVGSRDLFACGVPKDNEPPTPRTYTRHFFHDAYRLAFAHMALAELARTKLKPTPLFFACPLLDYPTAHTLLARPLLSAYFWNLERFGFLGWLLAHYRGMTTLIARWQKAFAHCLAPYWHIDERAAKHPDA